MGGRASRLNTGWAHEKGGASMSKHLLLFAAIGFAALGVVLAVLAYRSAVG